MRAPCCRSGARNRLLKEPIVLDLVYVLGIIAVFVLISAAAKGAEKL